MSIAQKLNCHCIAIPISSLIRVVSVTFGSLSLGRAATFPLTRKNLKAFFSIFRPCEIALKQLETIDDDAEKFSVDFVKVIDKRLAKQYNIQTFPTLTMFRDGEMTPFNGDLTNAVEVYDKWSIKLNMWLKRLIQQQPVFQII